MYTKETEIPKKKQEHMDLDFWGQLNLEESAWIENLYSKFQNKEPIPESWHYFFDGFLFGKSAVEDHDTSEDKSRFMQESKAKLLIDVYRTYGYLEGDLSFSGKSANGTASLISEKIANLYPEEKINSMGLFPNEEVTVEEMTTLLKKYYCGSAVVETLNCSPDLKEFIWTLMEKEPPIFSKDYRLKIYENLSRAVLFEEFLQIKHTGQKRFSLEGGEALVPMLRYMLESGEEFGIDHFVLGAAHRGRLNILTNVLGKPYEEVFMEFEDRPLFRGLETVGDVKYHKGYCFKGRIFGRKEIQATLLPNASHLESIDPIVEGVAYAIQQKTGSAQSVLPVFIHGDAAFSGQGIVYETLQFGLIRGYSTGGSLHLVINNGIGFTTSPHESRSTPYCTDIAKMFGIPVFRVNASDVEACLKVMSYALKIRSKFNCNVLIDFCCYRKFGHNEADDPSVTKPLLYEDIKKRPSLDTIYKKYLTLSGNSSEEELDRVDSLVREDLKESFEMLKKDSDDYKLTWNPGKCTFCQNIAEGLILSSFPVGLDIPLLTRIGNKLTELPSHFNPHPKLASFLDKRRKMLEGEIPCDWGLGEALAMGSLLIEGTPIRLSGQDSIRGTFNHRQAVWYDKVSGEGYFPFSHLASEQGPAWFYNSPLSEYGVLGFEFGFGNVFTEGLVIWEAQFGDFANGAQIIFDQYISCGIQKWDFHSSLVMLLPHGYEGQGPEHSSARMERYLQLASEWNFRVAYPSTPAQYFCLLREHVKLPVSIPLVVFTPKVLLRHQECVSCLDEFSSHAYFKNFLEEPEENRDAKTLVFCTGKIYYDFIEHRNKTQDLRFAVVRIESLYPLALEEVVPLLDKYHKAERYIWLQEEPMNMGAYEYVAMAFKGILPKNRSLEYVGRRRSSSTACGSSSLHSAELNEIMKRLFCK